MIAVRSAWLPDCCKGIAADNVAWHGSALTLSMLRLLRRFAAAPWCNCRAGGMGTCQLGPPRHKRHCSLTRAAWLWKLMTSRPVSRQGITVRAHCALCCVHATSATPAPRRALCAAAAAALSLLPELGQRSVNVAL